MKKNYFKRYIWLLDLFKTYGRLTLKEIQEKWTTSSVNETKTGLAPRTFHENRESIKELFEIEIRCDKSTNEYYIADEGSDSSSIRSWLLQAMSLNNLMNESSEIRGQILFEDVPETGCNLETIIRAMKAKKVIEMNYQGFSMAKSKMMKVEPWCIKQFRQRWYLIGYALYEGSSGIRTYLVERARDICVMTEDITHMEENFDGLEYLRNIYGVHMPYGQTSPQLVQLKVQDPQRRFLRNRPLHFSQEEMENTEKYSIFSFYLCPNFDFEQEIMSWGDQVEVVKPDSLRNKIKGTLENTIKNY